MTTKEAQDLLDRTNAAWHRRCIICGRGGQCGLDLRFEATSDGGVEASFECPQRYQGYDGVLHGGVTSSLLDSAMTNCLFARGIVAVTAELTVRFRHPVQVGIPLVVQAEIVRRQQPLFVLEARIVQDGQLKARAVGKFMERAPAR
ncbi:MAG: PaaI family thioesterase [Planctomycetes bacterium]|nr:PaaI family thioesterase [Planctomycetota bacterium]